MFFGIRDRVFNYDEVVFDFIVVDEIIEIVSERLVIG